MRGPVRALLLGLVLVIAATVRPAGSEEKPDPRSAALERIRTLHERLHLAPRDSHLNYAIATIARRHDLDLEREGIRFPLVPVVTGDPALRTDLFGVTTGAHALEESLQLTELLSPDGWEARGFVPLASLAPPSVPAHSIELPPDAGAHADAEASLLPADWLFLRVPDGGALAALCTEAHLWARHVLTVYHEDARAPVELGRAFERLGLPDPRRMPAVYAALGAPFAVGLADPFLREGTAVVVILPDGPVGEVLGRLVASDRVSEDGRVTRYRAVVGGRVVLSTSRAALERLRALTPEESLAASADYLDMRRRLPAGDDETAFLFLSDAFVRRMVGPRLKVLESRRLRCASHQRTTVNAALLHLEERGRAPASLEELTDGGYLTAAMLRCPDGGAYALERGIEPVCSVHGRPGALTPLLDLPLERVSAAEARAYRRYARAYEALWRQYFDPVGVRFARAGGGWRAETVILPLADSSLYRNLAEMSGGPPIETGVGPVAPSTVLLLSAKISRSFVRGLRADPLQLEERYGANLRDALLEGFGERATLGLLDDRMLFDFDLVGFLGNALRWRVSRDVLMAPVLAALNLPAYVTISVKDRARVERFLETLRQGVVRAAARPEGGFHSLRVGSYALEDADGPAIEVYRLGVGAFELRLYAALGETDLVIATRPEVIREVLTRGRPGPAGPYSFQLVLYPSRWTRLRTDMLRGYEEAARAACLRRLTELEAFRVVGPGEIERALGRRLSCPDGGELLDEPGRALGCSIHGRPARPRQPKEVPAANPAVRLLDETSELGFRLRFEDGGLRLRVERR
jgi:hypothetical protein